MVVHQVTRLLGGEMQTDLCIKKRILSFYDSLQFLQALSVPFKDGRISNDYVSCHEHDVDMKVVDILAEAEWNGFGILQVSYLQGQ